MFFLNKTCEYVIVDYDHLPVPDALIRELAKSSAKINIFSDELDESERRQLQQAYGAQRTLFISNCTSESELATHLRERMWKFDDLFFTGSTNRISIANQFAIGTVLVRETPDYDDAKTGPDLVIKPSQISDLVSKDFYAGNYGEIRVYPDRSTLPGYAAGKLPFLKVLKFQANHPSFNKAYTLGRYFIKDDTFMPCHAYTRFIKTCKGDPDRFKNLMQNLVPTTLAHILAEQNISGYYFTYVPKKPSDLFDRNLKILQNSNFSDKNIVRTLLKCPQDYPSQKEVGNQIMRRANVKDKYAAEFSLEAAPVILFDDVYTSGSTLAECAEVLLRAGASEVIPLTLALVCDETSNPLQLLTCECGSRMQVNFRKRDGIGFWGCPQRSNYPEKAHTTLDYRVGKEKLHKLWYDTENADIPF